MEAARFVRRLSSSRRQAKNRERLKGQQQQHLSSSSSSFRDWANLDDGPAGLIAERVLAYDVADYLRFRAVCCQWRRCSVDPRLHSSLDRRYHPSRWLMLQDDLLLLPHTDTNHPGPGRGRGRRRRFLNPSTGECIQVDIPELRDHKVLSCTREGLLLLLLHHDKNHIRLLNPLTHHLTQLPPLLTLQPPYPEDPFSDDLVDWGSAILNDDDSTVVLYFDCRCILGIAKPGDVCWKWIQFIPRMRPAISMFAGRFYCVTEDGVMVLLLEGQHPPRLELAANLCMHMHLWGPDTVHLVDCAGELILVHRRRFLRRRDSNNVAKTSYDTYRVDLDAGTLYRVNSSFGTGGRHALFIGTYCSHSVPIDVFPTGSIHGDTIYLSLDIAESDKTEGYHLADRSITPTARCPRWVVQPYTLVDCLALCNTRIRDSNFQIVFTALSR